ncbi:hypothetical protein ABZ249_12015 [Nocardiopsis sp. NPDC006139]|uniref:hypothetical protein n=1 Tax=Nocardiopsis sp. NPDC006139 TaxID=3154578 RepID=UPI0033A33C5A
MLDLGTVDWFRQGACPLMAWALVEQAARHDLGWQLAIIGDAVDWGDWWHMGAITPDHTYFIDAGGAAQVDEVCEQWHREHRQRRHPGHDTGLSAVKDVFLQLLWPDPRTADEHTRQVTLEFAAQILAAEGFLPCPRAAPAGSGDGGPAEA